MRLVALTAVAMMGTGCFVSSSDGGPINPGSGDALVYWNFTDWDNNVAGNFTAANSGCAVAAVTDVDLEILRGGVRVEFFTHPCEAGNGVPGTTVANLRPGTYTYQATAYRGVDPVFENFGSFTVGDGLETVVETTLDVLTPQPLSIFFSRAGVFTCTGVSSVFYALYTPGGVSLISSASIACPSNQELYFPQPAASQVGSTYFVDFLQLLDGGGLSTHEKCGVNVRHTGFPVTVDLPAGVDPACG
jgi:hypothetical protein